MKTVNQYKIVGQKHAYRALEIAAEGSLSVTIIGPPGIGKRTLAAIYSSVGCTILLPCPCGNYQHPSVLCTCTYDDIQAHLRENAKAFDADILIEMMPISVEDLLFIPAIAELEPASQSLIEAAYRNLHLSPARLLRSISIAKVIAELDVSANGMCSYHVAEALRYQTTVYGNAR